MKIAVTTQERRQITEEIIFCSVKIQTHNIEHEHKF